jgi:hypothetical protein
MCVRDMLGVVGGSLCVRGLSMISCLGPSSGGSVWTSYQSAYVLTVLKPNRIICKHTDVNCSSFHLTVFLGLSNSQGQR